jgi:hypothetical protein
MVSVSTQPDSPSSRRSIPRYLARILAWLKRDGLALGLYAAGTFLLTYPLGLFISSDMLLPNSTDLYYNLWDIWWLERLLHGAGQMNMTPMLYYPAGLDITYSAMSWTTSAAALLLKPLVGILTAYKLLGLFAVFSTGYAAYLLLRTLVNSRAAAWVGGAVYTFIPYHVTHTKGHPNLTQLAPVPIAILLFLQGLAEGHLLLSVAAGLLLGITAWTSLYLFGFTTMTLALLFVYLALDERRWQQKGFWQATAAFVVGSSVLLAPRLFPILRNYGELSYVIEEKHNATLSTDVLAYVAPPDRNLLLSPVTNWIVDRAGEDYEQELYLGLIPIWLVIFGLAHREKQQEKLAWLGIGVWFLMLELGPVLHVAKRVYLDVPLPGFLLQRLPLIKTVRPFTFQVALALPLAVLAAYGMDDLLTAFSRRTALKYGLLIGLPFVMMLEYWPGFYQFEPNVVSPFYEEIAAQEEEFALIDLPFQMTPKYYTYLQITHGKPIAGGATARMPSDATAYIDANPLLAAWYDADALDCEAYPGDTMQAALVQLDADGFRYIILHTLSYDWLNTYFTTVTPIFQDDTATVYLVDSLLASPPCGIQLWPLPEAQAAPLLDVPNAAGERPCGVFDVKGHGWREVPLRRFPSCGGALDDLSIMCLDAEANWRSDKVADLTPNRAENVLAFTSHQDGACAIFP